MSGIHEYKDASGNSLRAAEDISRPGNIRMSIFSAAASVLAEIYLPPGDVTDLITALGGYPVPPTEHRGPDPEISLAAVLAIIGAVNASW